VQCDSPLDKDEIIKLIASKVPEGAFSVDLKSPDFTILVEIFKNTVGIGVAQEYKELKKYNLQEIQGFGQDNKPKQKVKEGAAKEGAADEADEAEEANKP